MKKRLSEKVVNVYAVLYAIFVVLLPAWYKRHRSDANYYLLLGFLAGLSVSLIIMILEAVT